MPFNKKVKKKGSQLKCKVHHSSLLWLFDMDLDRETFLLAYNDLVLTNGEGSQLHGVID